MERHKERSVVKIHTKISGNLCNWFLIIKEKILLCKSICFIDHWCPNYLREMRLCFPNFRECLLLLQEQGWQVPGFFLPTKDISVPEGQPDSGHPDRWHRLPEPLVVTSLAGMATTACKCFQENKYLKALGLDMSKYSAMWCQASLHVRGYVLQQRVNEDG